MTFGLNWDDGYIICVTLPDNHGYWKPRPLRKFLHQGDALAFREFDCPHLSDAQLRALIKQYDPAVKYRRIDSKHFRRL